MSPTHWGALREFVRCHHLHIQVFALRLAPGFDEPLEHLQDTQSLEVKKGQGGKGSAALNLTAPSARRP